LTRGEQHYRLTFAVLLVGVVAYALLQSLVLPVLPTIQRSLHTSQEAVTWVLTAYLLSASVFTPILGRLGDIAGKKEVYVLALCALAIGSLIAALAPSIGVMIVARAIQGIGGGVLPIAFGIIRDEFPHERLSGAISIAAAVAAAGGGLGIAFTGPIIGVLDFHWLFWIPMIMVLAAAVAAWRFIPDSPSRSARQINWRAAAALSGWLVALLVSVSEGSQWGWTSGRVLLLLAVAVVLFVVWVRVEWRSPVPLIDMHMMRLRAVWTTNLVAFLFGIGLYSVFAFLPAFVQTRPSAGYGFGASVTQSGFYLVPLSLMMFVLGLVCGRLVERLGARMVLTVGATMSILPFVGLAVAHGRPWEIYVESTVLGAGFGLAFSALSILIVNAVPIEQTGAASGMNANVRTIGGSIGAAVMAGIVTSGVRTHSLPQASGYTHGFELLAAATALAAAAAILVPNVKRTVGSHRPEDELHAELSLLASGTLAGTDFQ